MRFKLVGVSFTLLVVLAFAATPAGAIVANTAGGRVGYLPLNEAATSNSAGPIRSTIPSGEPPLEYHGGPVMHSQAAYAIFWAPSGYSFPAGYTTAITNYLENVADDSGKPSNVYSVSAQYFDGTGHATYSDTYGGSVTDTNTYPTSGTCAPYVGAEAFTACISDAKMKAQVDSIIAAEGWPSGLGAEYYVVLPPHAGSCIDVAGKTCFDKVFCAYHGFAATNEAIYANISYSPGDPLHCGVEQYPNGKSNGNVDDTLSSLSHEANESITDPLLNAWYEDAEGLENGDECRNTPFKEDYGPPLGGSSGTLFNQEIGTGHYFLQQEWSNDINDCAQRVKLPMPVIADPGQIAVGQSTLLDAGGSVLGSGHIASYSWNFGDGHSGSGKTVSHTFEATGEFTVTLTLEDDGGFESATANRKVSVVNGHSLTVSTAGSGSGTVTAPGISCPGTCTHIYPIGESVRLTAAPAAGSGFAGWSGAGCSGTGSCEVTLSADQDVTATFTTLPPAPAGVSSTPLPARRTVVKCRKGFKKAKKQGKTVCVKKKHHHKHH